MIMCLDFLDVITFIALIIITFFTYKIFKKIPADQVGWLFVGFILMSILQLGFIVINYIPITGTSDSLNRLIAEITVAARVIPVIFISVGMGFLYESVSRLIKGNGGINWGKKSEDKETK